MGPHLPWKEAVVQVTHAKENIISISYLTLRCHLALFVLLVMFLLLLFSFPLFLLLLFKCWRQKTLVESHEIWDLTAALAYQLVVTLTCHVVLWGVSSFTCKMGELVILSLPKPC